MNSPNQSIEPRYRPVLSSSQISHILTLCRRDMSDESLRVISTLAQFEHKIRNAAVAPAYNKEVRASLSESLGFDDAKITANFESAHQLYERWKSNPAALSVKELETVRAHRYLSGLMTPDEAIKYEVEVIGIGNLNQSGGA